MKVKEILSDALAIAAAVMLSIGAGMIYPPAGVICGGICLGLISYAIGTSDGGAEK